MLDKRYCRLENDYCIHCYVDLLDHWKDDNPDKLTKTKKEIQRKYLYEANQTVEKQNIKQLCLITNWYEPICPKHLREIAKEIENT